MGSPSFCVVCDLGRAIVRTIKAQSLLTGLAISRGREIDGYRMPRTWETESLSFGVSAGWLIRQSHEFVYDSAGNKVELIWDMEHAYALHADPADSNGTKLGDLQEVRAGTRTPVSVHLKVDQIQAHYFSVLGDVERIGRAAPRTLNWSASAPQWLYTCLQLRCFHKAEMKRAAGRLPL